jgi:hypothetical protein
MLESTVANLVATLESIAGWSVSEARVEKLQARLELLEANRFKLMYEQDSVEARVGRLTNAFGTHVTMKGNTCGLTTPVDG